MAAPSQPTLRVAAAPVLGYVCCSPRSRSEPTGSIRVRGLTLIAPTAPPGQPLFGAGDGASHVDALMHVLLALVVVIVVARAIGSLFALLRISRRWSARSSPASCSARRCSAASRRGAAFLLPPVGGAVPRRDLAGRRHPLHVPGRRSSSTRRCCASAATRPLAISHASIVAPFLLGAALALYLYPQLSTRDVPFTVLLAVPGRLDVGDRVPGAGAHPHRSRACTRRAWASSRSTCAAVDDVTAWCLLAFVVSVAQARAAGAVVTIALRASASSRCMVAAWCGPAMVRLSRLYGIRGRLTQGVMALVFVALLLLGAGHRRHRHPRRVRRLRARRRHPARQRAGARAHRPPRRPRGRAAAARVLRLHRPAHADRPGHRRRAVADVRRSSSLVASLGKFGGRCVAARLTGLGWRDSSALGVLMNTRGLMELIVLNIGLELRRDLADAVRDAGDHGAGHDLHDHADPALHHARPSRSTTSRSRRREPSTPPSGGGLLVPISNPEGLAPLLDLAAAATRPEDPPPRVLALVRRPAGGIRSGLREIDRKESPRSPVLDAGDRSRARGRARRSTRRRCGPTTPPATSSSSRRSRTSAGCCSAITGRCSAAISSAAWSRKCSTA